MSFDLFYARLPFVVQHYYHIHTIGTLVRTVVPCGGTTTTYNFCSLCFLCCILTYYFLDILHFYKKKTFFVSFHVFGWPQPMKKFMRSHIISFLRKKNQPKTRVPPPTKFKRNLVVSFCDEWSVHAGHPKPAGFSRGR